MVEAGLAITWLGHATVLIEIDGVRVITDPVLRHRVGPLVRVIPVPPTLDPVDCVLISHLHADHADPPSLRTLRCRGPLVAPRPAKTWLTARYIANATDLHPGEELKIGGVRISATPASHDGRRFPLGPAADPVGYLIRGSSSVYFAGDTDLFPAMAELRGQVDVALLPIWGWGPRLGAGHLDPERAAAAAALIAPNVAIPIHWGTFVLWPRRHPTDSGRPAREFAACARRHAPAVEVRILSPGEQTTIWRG